MIKKTRWIKTMKKSEIEIGGHYSARVSGNFVTVRVDDIDSVLTHNGYDYMGKPKPYKDKI